MIAMGSKAHASAAKRRCPRCGGNIFLDKDYDGWYMECLQCSYTRDLNVLPMPPVIRQSHGKGEGRP
jgi:ribosomal protein S27AE